MKIVHVIADANRSGAPAHVLQLAAGLNKQQFQSIVLGPDGPARQDFLTAKIDYRVVPMGSKFNQSAIKQIRSQIEKLGKEHNELIVHCHGVRAGLLGRLAARSLKYSIVYSEHSWTKDYHLPNKLNEFIQVSVLRYLDRFTTKTIGVSKAVVDFLVKARITRPEKVVRIYNGVDFPENLISPNTQPVLGSIGSLTWQKNYGFLIEVMPEIIKEVPEAELEIIGEGPERENLEARIKTLGLVSKVTLSNPITHNLLPTSYKNWALYIQPSVNEAFGLAAAEAMAAGLPTLGANVGSLPELLGTENALFDLTRKEETVSKIVEFLKNNTKRAELRDLQLEHVEKFSVDKMIREHEELYLMLS